MADRRDHAEVLTRLRLKLWLIDRRFQGTAIRSLKQLYLMPFSELKIDISFGARCERSR